MTCRRSARADLEATVSARAIDKSGRVLKAVSLLYFPFHDIRLTELFSYFGPLAFISAAVYQADEANERPTGGERPTLRIVEAYLHRHGLLDRRTKAYVRDGNDYLRRERAFRGRRAQSIQALDRVMYLRSSDFRILHCVLHQLRDVPYDQRVFDAFAPFELLMEIEDDIASFHKDTVAQSFNFVRTLQGLATGNVARLIEDKRARVLQLVSDRSRRLPSTQRTRIAHVLDVYRSLVPEPSPTGLA